jgi:hypothetical protein
MSYIGSDLTSTSYLPSTRDRFSGNNVATTFTLSKAASTASDLIVVVNNVLQDPYTAYSVSGDQLTFTGAPDAGVDNIYVTYNARITQFLAPSPGATVPGSFAVTGDLFSQSGTFWQYVPAPTTKSAAASLTPAELKTTIINTTGTSYTITLPTGTDIDSSFALLPVANIGFDFHVINTASGTITVSGNTNVTSLGALTVPTATSAHFRMRRSDLNTYVVYRLA